MKQFLDFMEDFSTLDLKQIGLRREYLTRVLKSQVMRCLGYQ
jgi:hypothetical protein